MRIQFTFLYTPPQKLRYSVFPLVYLYKVFKIILLLILAQYYVKTRISKPDDHRVFKKHLKMILKENYFLWILYFTAYNILADCRDWSFQELTKGTLYWWKSLLFIGKLDNILKLIPTNLETCSLIRLTSPGCELLLLLLEVLDLILHLWAEATHGIYNTL